MVRYLALFQALCILLIAPVCIADMGSPAGLWRTIDDKTDKPRSLVRIYETNGIVTAVVEKGLLKTDKGDRVCTQCKDDRKDQPIIGMEVVRDMKRNGGRYDGGTILDPDNGKTYKCIMKLNDAGDALEVRGYIGISLIGRSQIWQRVE